MYRPSDAAICFGCTRGCGCNGGSDGGVSVVLDGTEGFETAWALGTTLSSLTSPIATADAPFELGIMPAC